MSKNITLNMCKNMCQNFRVKLDFCNYYNDIRRFCWIFIDCTKMLRIDDIKKHIKKLFGINDPFDLLLNKNEYLPPREDIRILKENEIILVSPGSHFSSDQFNNLPLYYAVSLIDENKEELEDSAHSEQIEELISQSDKNSIQQEQLSINFPTVLSSQEDLSIDTTNNFQDDAEMYDTTTNTEICNTLPKRNHIRHRKKKIKVDTQLAEEDKSVKSKITNPIISSIISSCKHIGFDIVDDKIVMKDQVICPSNIVDAIHKLENILSSVKSAIPLTFGNDRVKDMTKKEKEEKDNTEDTEVNTVSKNINGNTVSTERLEEINKFLGIDFETYEVMVVRPKVNDIIAFKVLKIGTDYMPQMSNFIVAEVIFYYSEISLYKLKILQGLSEVQVRLGKFTIIEKTGKRVLNDIITLHHAQIIKPRLVSYSVKRYPS